MAVMFDSSAALIAEWIANANSGRVEGLIDLYAKDAILLPTFSSRPIHTPEAMRQYFQNLSTQKDLHVSLHESTLRVQPLRAEMEAASGIYRFSFRIDDEPLAFEARFTYVLDLTLAAPIVTHHSSQIPRNLP